MIVYWMEFVTDLLLRSLIRAWRRLVELVRAFGRTLAAILIFGVVATWRVMLTVALPVAFLIAGALVAKALADSSLTYILSDRWTKGWAELLKAVLYAGMLFLLGIIIISFLVRCHPSSVVVKEGFQAFSYHLPNFLLLLYVTSIILSLLSWATKAGPFRFGLLSIILTAFLVVLFAVVVLRSKKKPKAVGVKAGKSASEHGPTEPASIDNRESR
jgi:hypothetical protein